MFQSVRPNSQLYVLHKGDNLRLEIGVVSNTPIPKPKYAVPPTFGQPQEMVVDIIAKINGQSVNYNSLPSQADIADSSTNGELITVSDNKEAMNAELLGLKQKSLDIINSTDYHKQLIESCDKILSDLNPEFAEKQAQKEEIDNLKNQVNEMSTSIKELMETNRRLIAQLSLKES